MRICFRPTLFGFALPAFALIALALGGTASFAASSVVRADPRSGRLVRTFAAPPTAAPSKLPTAALPRSGVHEAIAETSLRHDVDPLLVQSVIAVESAYNPFAISPKGAQGLMQLIPGTARHFGVTNAFDRRQNVEGGVKYLKHLMSQFGDMRLVLAAYNAGENAVLHYNGIPPYDETQEYVYKVGKRYGELRRARKTPTQQAKLDPPPAEPLYRPVETFIDSEGRVNLRTR